MIIHKRPIWSINILQGINIYNLAPLKKSPVFMAKNVTDIKAEFVADPFIVKHNKKYYMFFEVLHKYDRKGRIALATSDDLLNWKYEKIILDEKFHLSYPYVFKHEKDHYMLPECGESGYMKLYKCIEFPFKWEFNCNLLEGDFGDSSLFRYDNKYWILAEKKEDEKIRFNNLHLYYTENLFDEWKEHPKSPIISGNFEDARPAGRIVILEDKIYRFAQKDMPYYGEKINAFEIIKLNIKEYEEKKLQIDFKGSEKNRWNKDGMHHIDIFMREPNNLIACVDGHVFKNYLNLKFKIERNIYRLIKKLISNNKRKVIKYGS